MKTLYIECAMGAAGDMLMSALYELLDNKDDFLRAMNSLGLPGVEVHAGQAVTAGIAGTHMRVLVHGQEELEHGHEHPHEHGHCPEHKHCHEHEHEHPHEHGHCHGHEHCHDHEHEHCHDHEHPHEHGHCHDHVHGEELSHTHSHEHGHAHHHHAGPGEIAALIDTLPLPETVRKRARSVYDAIAAAEARAHGCPVGDVHFHEVGALDAVADVVGVCYAMELLAPDRVVVSPVHVGSGTVRCAHGVMPVPAPATSYLLEGVPIYGGAVRGELCTPTGAALLREFASSFGSMPAMVTECVGIGVGTKQFEQANCVRAFFGRESAGEAAPGSEANGEICELVCNLDDMTPEELAFAASRLLELGALDVYLTPGTMKKGRPGHVLTVLCEPLREAEFARLILRHTTTNGLRVRCCAKYFLKPGQEETETPWGTVRVKTAEGFGVTHRKMEFEDAAALARKHDIPLPKLKD